MNKLIPLISLAYLLPLEAQAAPVEWDFVDDTSRITVASLTLTGPDSAGSAIWPINNAATYTGDSFAFNFDFPHHQSLTPAFNPTTDTCYQQDLTPQDNYRLCEFSISWSESLSVLNAVDIRVDSLYDGIRADLSTAIISSVPASYGPCPTDNTCHLSGSWIDAPPAVSEPNSFVLLGIAFGFLGLIKRYGRTL